MSSQKKSNIILEISVGGPLAFSPALYLLGPGSGVQCRDKLCHKYATCSIVFETQSKAVCQVLIALYNNSIPLNITTFVNSILLY